MAELTGVAKPVPEAHTKRAVKARSPELYTVETISSGKVTIAKFKPE